MLVLNVEAKQKLQDVPFIITATRTTIGQAFKQGIKATGGRFIGGSKGL